MTSIKIDSLSKAYGDHRVLTSIDLDIPGGVTAVLGPSGCGKTTLLRVIAGFLEPDHGSISFNSELITDTKHSVPAQRRRVGYVPQEGALFPHLNVADNIAYGLPGNRWRKGDRRTRHREVISRLLSLVELDSRLADRFPGALSGGQQQRVALARALAPEPAVVLLDEPFSSLDATLREDTGRAVTRALRALGTTALLVTHDQDEALSLADNVAVLRNGRLIQVAAPTELYLRPADAEVARFVGRAQVLSGDFDGRSAITAIGTLDLDDPLPPKGPVTVAIRPEQIVVSLETNSAMPGVAAKVIDVQYYGHDATIRAQIVDNGSIVSARTNTANVPAVGALVHLSVPLPVISFSA